LIEPPRRHNEPDSRTIAARHDPEAIMLDFMQPIRPAWRTFCGRGKAWFYEVSTQTQQHDVTVSDEALERPLAAQPGMKKNVSSMRRS